MLAAIAGDSATIAQAREGAGFRALTEYKGAEYNPSASDSAHPGWQTAKRQAGRISMRNLAGFPSTSERA